MEKRIVVGINQLDLVVDYFKDLLNVCNVFTFTGSLGAGKTTLVRALLKRCGVDGVITSPTFTYLNRYKNKQGRIFYHFDLYRIETLNDFISAGFDEYLYEENSFCFIEWPEIIMPILKNKICHVMIEHCGVDKREFIFTIG